MHPPRVYHILITPTQTQGPGCKQNAKPLPNISGITEGTITIRMTLIRIPYSLCAFPSKSIIHQQLQARSHKAQDTNEVRNHAQSFQLIRLVKKNI